MIAKEIVSLLTARMLKAAGFKWKTQAAWDLTYSDDPYLNYDASYSTNFNNDADDILYAPTLSEAQRWLREEKNVLVWVNPNIIHDKDDEDKIDHINGNWWNVYVWAGEGGHSCGDGHSYEDALENGIEGVICQIL